MIVVTSSWNIWLPTPLFFPCCRPLGTFGVLTCNTIINPRSCACALTSFGRNMPLLPVQLKKLVFSVDLDKSGNQHALEADSDNQAKIWDLLQRASWHFETNDFNYWIILYRMNDQIRFEIIQFTRRYHNTRRAMPSNAKQCRCKCTCPPPPSWWEHTSSIIQICHQTSITWSAGQGPSGDQSCAGSEPREHLCLGTRSRQVEKMTASEFDTQLHHLREGII